MRRAEQKTILLVEDDLDIREALAAMLEELGYRVALASDGREALEYLMANEPPRLILLDLLMPRMSGYEFRAEQLRDPRLASIPVVVLSGDQDVHAKADALRDVPCLEKPPHFIQLVSAIEQALPA